jgi:hypothetical protein
MRIPDSHFAERLAQKVGDVSFACRVADRKEKERTLMARTAQYL